MMYAGTMNLRADVVDWTPEQAARGQRWAGTLLLVMGLGLCFVYPPGGAFVALAGLGQLAFSLLARG